MNYQDSIDAMSGEEISPERKNIHMASEAIAVLTIAPFLIAVGLSKKPIDPISKKVLVGLGVGTLVLDGYLLSKWKQ